MVNINLLSLEKETLIYVPLYAGVKVRCIVNARPLSVLVHIYDGRYNRFRTRRFTSNTLAGVDEFISLFDSIKNADSSLQSFAIAYFLASTAIESLSAKLTLELFNSYLPISKDC
jgi:hypothetical protein